MKKRAVYSVIALASILFLMGCQGEEGPAGPVGPTGPTGPQGPGAIAVTFTLANADFTSYGGGIWVCDRAVSAITSDIVATGAVLGYYQSGLMVVLPWTSDSQMKRKYFHYGTGTVRFVVADYAATPVLDGAGTWKIVIVPGELLSGGLLNNVDIRSYQAVATALDLKE